MLQLKFKRLTPTMTIPTKAHTRDACFDLYADLKGREISKDNCLYREDDNCLGILPHKTVLVPTGLALGIPKGYWCPVFARSGVASKQGLRPAQGVPVIDEPYTGELLVPLHNDTDILQFITHGQRIAQFMLLPWYETELVEVDELEDTDRGTNGFGSSGV